MAPRDVRLVVSDLDGTLLRSDRTVSDRTRTAITGLATRGIMFAVVTGRAPRHLTMLGIDASYGAIAVCGNGSALVDIATGAILERTIIEPTIAVGLVEDLERAVPGCVFAAEMGSVWGRDPRFRSVETEPPPLAEPGAALAARGAIKLMVQHPEQRASELLERVRDVAADRVTTTRSTDRFVELGPMGVDKGHGVRRLRQRLGSDRDGVVAIGDMLNDLPMFTEAGWRVAVANAHPEVIAAADQVTASNDDEGVALVLEGL